MINTPTVPFITPFGMVCTLHFLQYIKTHDSESRGQEEAGHTRDEQVSYLHVASL